MEFSLKHPSLQQHLQIQPILGTCRQYQSFLQWFQVLHRDMFPLIAQQYRRQTPITTSTQPTLAQIRQSLQGETEQKEESKQDIVIKPGRPRKYRTKSYEPGECNNGRTFASSLQHAPIPRTPSTLYQLTNPNSSNRHFTMLNEVYAVFTFKPNEWMDFAKTCLKRTDLLRLRSHEPLMKYIHYCLRRQKHIKESCIQDEMEPPPQIFGPKLTKDQVSELLDAYYWANMAGGGEGSLGTNDTVDLKKTCQTILFSYKLYGHYVRKKDRYRVTKPVESRRLVQNRNLLIQHGVLDFQPPKDFEGDPSKKVKSLRGRKRKRIVE